MGVFGFLGEYVEGRELRGEGGFFGLRYSREDVICYVVVLVFCC